VEERKTAKFIQTLGGLVELQNDKNEDNNT
jgi:hypothetical protein